MVTGIMPWSQVSSRGHRCLPFSPPLPQYMHAFIFIAQRVHHSHCTSIVIELAYHTIDIARNVVFYCLLVKANNAIFYCHLLLLFCGRFERSGVQASCRAPNSVYTKRIDIPTDVAVQVVSLVLGGVVYPW